MNYTISDHKEKKTVEPVLSETANIVAHIDKESAQKLNESAQDKKRKLIVRMEAIHVGRTQNYNYYTKEGLKAGIESWTTPYPKPVLTHHNQYFGEPIGRILKAEFSEETLSGKPGLIFVVEISDADAIEKVLDGRYQTVSIGAKTDKVTCNICGKDRTKEWCEHWPGREYDGQTAHFIIGTVYGREVSYVNVPADENAGNISVEVKDEGSSDEGKKESQETKSLQAEIFQVAEGLFQSAQEPNVNLREKLSEQSVKWLDELLEGEERSEQHMSDNKIDKEKQEQSSVQEKTEVEEQDIKVLEEKIQDMQKTITDLVMEKQKVELKLNDLQSSYNELVKENSKLNQKIHMHLAEQVVDLKIALNKPDVTGVDREEAIKAHVQRSQESLQNTLEDLKLEVNEDRPEAGIVKNPGYSGNGEGDKRKKYTMSEAENLIKSMFGMKKN